MMGRQAGGQGQFFYEFELNEVVPADHLVRQLDALLDLSWIHKELAPYYSHTGRPSIGSIRTQPERDAPSHDHSRFENDVARGRAPRQEL
jgi:hypothetical protein